MSEKIKCPADSKVREASSVKQMFSRVAPFYDFINRAMTFGLDIVWRKRLVRLLELSNGDVRVIDIACGSGDVAIEIAKQNPNAKIVCSDFCVPMLEIAEAKFAKKYPNRAEFKEELIATSEVLEEMIQEEVVYVRPPYGTWDKSFEKELNMIPVLWNVDPLDWCSTDVAEIVKKIVEDTGENDIILMHDYFETSVEAALKVVDILLDKGYTFVTVEEILFE